MMRSLRGGPPPWAASLRRSGTTRDSSPACPKVLAGDYAIFSQTSRFAALSINQGAAVRAAQGLDKPFGWLKACSSMSTGTAASPWHNPEDRFRETGASDLH